MEQFTRPQEKTGLSPKLRNFVNLPLLAGVALIFSGTALNLLTTTTTSLPPKPPSEIISTPIQEKVVKPQRISIPSLKVDSLITEGGVKNSKWVLSENSVLFLPTAGMLGKGYNTILYAHKRFGLFKDLKKIKTGAEILVEDTNGDSFTYRVYSIERVRATEISKLKSDIKNTLTLFTCDGLFDQFRLVVKASLATDFSSSSLQDGSGTNPPENLLNPPVSSPAASPILH